MYNPDKQARTAGGRFGGKKVEAQIADVATAATAVVTETAEAIGAVEQAYAPEIAVSLANYVPEEIDANTQTKAGLATLFGLGAFLMVAFGLLAHCVR